MKRPLTLVAAWLVAAGLAVGLGFLAVSLVDAGGTTGTTPAAATGPSGGGPAAPSSAPPSSGNPTAGAAAPATGEFATPGGTVYADCTSGSPVLAGVPASGWWVDDSDDVGEIEFENGSQEVEVHVYCAAGSPSFFQEGPRSDDGGGRRGGGATTAPAPTSGHDAGDDRGGDRHGGSSGRGGSDDGPGDDSSGRSGGGHGSDG